MSFTTYEGSDLHAALQIGLDGQRIQDTIEPSIDKSPKVLDPILSQAALEATFEKPVPE